MSDRSVEYLSHLRVWDLLKTVKTDVRILQLSLFQRTFSLLSREYPTKSPILWSSLTRTNSPPHHHVSFSEDCWTDNYLKNSDSSLPTFTYFEEFITEPITSERSDLLLFNNNIVVLSFGVPGFRFPSYRHRRLTSRRLSIVFSTVVTPTPRNPSDSYNIQVNTSDSPVGEL